MRLESNGCLSQSPLRQSWDNLIFQTVNKLTIKFEYYIMVFRHSSVELISARFDTRQTYNIRFRARKQVTQTDFK